MVNITKQIVNAKPRKISAKWTVEVPKDLINEVNPKVLELYIETLRVEEQANLGAFTVSNIGTPWDRYVVKPWMSECLEGDWLFSLHKCAFKLESDASLFALKWL